MIWLFGMLATFLEMSLTTVSKFCFFVFKLALFKSSVLIKLKSFSIEHKSGEWGELKPIEKIINIKNIENYTHLQCATFSKANSALTSSLV